MRWESKPEPRFGGMEHDGTFGGDPGTRTAGAAPPPAPAAPGAAAASHSYRAPAQAPQRPLASVRPGVLRPEERPPGGASAAITAGGHGGAYRLREGHGALCPAHGGDALAEVAFDTVGKKKLMLKSAGAHMRKL